MNFKDKIKKIAKDREEGKWFNLFGYGFKLRSIKSRHMKKFLLENKIKNIKNHLEEKENETIKNILTNIVVDWDLKNDETNEPIPCSEEKIIEILLEKDEKGDYHCIELLDEIFQAIMLFDSNNILFSSAKNF